MKISPNLESFNISAKGMGLQKRKMDLIAENISNINTTKTADGTVYRRKYLRITSEDKFQNSLNTQTNKLTLKASKSSHMEMPVSGKIAGDKSDKINQEVKQDNSTGERLYMPDHPDADKEGYLEMPNVNVVNEMVDMIAATRSYEANLTAFNSAKDIAKDSLEI